MTSAPAHSTRTGDGHATVDDDRDPGVDASLSRVQRPALLAAAVGLVLLFAGLFIHNAQAFFQAYLYAYLFWTGIALGCFSILMLGHLVGGKWGAVIRRPLESGARLLPLMALLFIPVVLGMNNLYEWTDPQWRQSHAGELMRFKLWWLSKPAFVVRAAIYFAVWIGITFILNRWGDEQDRTGDPRLFRKMQQFSAPGLVLYVATMTLAAFDWAMSLDPDWMSTIWGLLFVVAQALGTMAMVITLLAMLADRRPFAGVLTIPIFHDLGNLLMAFTMLWAYISFSQYLIIWSANIAEETPYYVARTQTGWKYVALVLVIFHFFVPFVLLLWRRTKRNVRGLAAVAGWIALLRLVDLFWVIGPSFGRDGAGHGGRSLAHAAAEGHASGELHGWWHAWMYPAAAAAIGGLFVFAFIHQFKRRPLLPLHDPRLVASGAGGHP